MDEVEVTGSEVVVSPSSDYQEQQQQRQPPEESPMNPQSGSRSTSSSPSKSNSITGTSKTTAQHSPRRPSQSHKSGGSSGNRRDLPPLFWYMEMGDWEKAAARAKSHPREVKTRATLRTKSMAEDGSKVTGTKRLALHHACFKLRSAGSAPVPAIAVEHNNNNNNSNAKQNREDPFLAVCKFILLLLEIYPEACQVRESRHGCLPLHLAAFASCYVRPPSSDDDEQAPMPSVRENPAAPAHRLGRSVRHCSISTAGLPLERPGVVSVRSTSESTTSTTYSNMTAVLMEEDFAGLQQQRKKEGGSIPSSPKINRHSTSEEVAVALNDVSIAASTTSRENHNTAGNNNNDTTSNTNTHANTIFISNKREQMAVRVLNAMLDAHPRAIRLDSEGGRLPLHTACAGRATPRCVSLLLRAYPAASRHRNKDGFLPLHLAAHWGVSHPNVAIILLKAYPDATVGRNRWERTPLEEALVMAGENGRPYQAPLVRALRKHPSYWTRPPKELFSNHLAETSNRESHLVDMDVTLASNDDETSADGNPNYFNAGHSCLLVEDEYENVPEGEETQLDSNQQGGLISRLRRKSSARNVVAASSDISQDLPTLIKNLKWKSVIARLEYNPDEASQELVGVMTRGGFTSGSNMTPLHYACERKPPLEVVDALMEANPEAVTQRMMPGGALPLHIACTWHSSPAVVSALLGADPSTAKVVDELGNRPLHSACFSGAVIAVVHDLLATYPKAVLARNNQGSQPIDICRRLKHGNRRAVMAALLDKKEYIIAKQKHRSSKSSGSMGAMAQTAARMNDTLGCPEELNNRSNHNSVPDDGVEVTYEGEDKSQPLIWI